MSTQPQQYSSTSVVAVGVVFAFLMPLIGFILGLTQINKAGNEGLVIVCLSVFMGLFYWYLLA